MNKFDNEAQWLWDWTHTSSLSYGDFLKAKSFERSLRFGIDDQTKSLIASNEQLLKEGFATLNETISEGVSVLAGNLSAIESAIVGKSNEIISTLEWGFGGLLAQFDRLNDATEELVRLAKTPSQAWAFEQFEVARDEYRRGLYPEALQSIVRAIEGFGSNVGYRTEFRFHQLLGLIRLGSWLDKKPNYSEEIVDVKLAETAFLSAARYAEADAPVSAAECYIYAGRAAWLQNSTKRALEHTQRGLTLNPNDLKGRYQIAKFLIFTGDIPNGERHLSDLFILEPTACIKAASEREFTTHKSALDGAIRKAIAHHFRQYEELRDRARRALAKVQALRVDGVECRQIVPEIEAEYRSLETKAECELAYRSLLNVVDAKKTLLGTQSLLDRGVRTFQQRFIDAEKTGLESEGAKRNSIVNDGSGTGIGLGGAVLLWLVFLGWGIHRNADDPVAIVLFIILSGGLVGIFLLMVGAGAARILDFVFRAAEDQREQTYQFKEQRSSERIQQVKALSAPSI